MSLSELAVMDDLNISMDPQTYQDQTDPPPPLPGNYRLVVVGPLKARTDLSGKPVLTDGKFPVLTIMRAKIVEPSESEKEFGLFADLRTKPYDRYGTFVSDLGDMTRALDQTRPWNGLREGLDVLDELVAQNTPFAVQLAWEGYDTAFVEQEFARLGVTKQTAKSALSDSDYKAVYKKARIDTKAFRPDGRGGRMPIALGPSGTMVKAKVRIKKFFPSLETVNLGQFKVAA